MLTLEDFGGRKRRFLLETVASPWTVIRGAAAWPSAGFATFTFQVFWWRSSTIVGVFTDRKTLLLRVGSHLFDLSSPNVQLADRFTWGLLRRFTVLVNGNPEVSVLYSGLTVDLGESEEKFFAYVMTFNDKRQVERTVFVWTSALEGRDLETDEFEHELETRFPT